MRKNKSKSFILFVFWCLAQLGNAQVVKETKGLYVLQYPSAFYAPGGDLKPEKAISEFSGPCTQWVVFSDRDNNSTYTDATGATAYKKMRFLEVFFVIAQKDEYLHIVKYPANPGGAVDFSTNQIRKELEDYGWIKRENLLLWKSALVDDKNFLPLRGLLIDPVYNSKKTTLPGFKFFSSPDYKSPLVPSEPLSDFFYVFKRENESCLIGNYSKIDNPETVGINILGWVNQSYVQYWGTRIALELNSDKDALKERRANKISSCLLANGDEASLFKNSGSIQTDFHCGHQDVCNSIKYPGYNRFPLLEKKVNEQMKLAVMTDIYGDNPEIKMTLEEMNEVESNFNVALTSFRNLNVVFVVDGSGWMKEYFPIISNSLLALNDYLMGNSRLNKDNFRTSAVIYRDYSEKECTDGDITFEKMPFRDSFSEMASFFSDDTKARNCKDLDKYQAVYGGINEALKMLENRNNESNMIILIGSGANNIKDKLFKKQDIANALAEKNCSLFSFRVKSQAEDVYHDFVGQTKDLIIESARIIQARNQRIFPSKPMVKSEFRERLSYPKTSPLPGAVCFTEDFKQISGDTLTKKLIGIIDEYIDERENIVLNIRSFFRRLSPGGSLNEGAYFFLSRANISSSMLEKISAAHYQSYIPAYAYNTISNLKLPLFKHTLLLTDFELNVYLNHLRNMLSNLPEKKLRNNLKSLLVCLAELHLGYDRFDNSEKFRDDGWFRYLTSSLPFRSPLLNAYRLNISQVEDPGMLSNQLLGEIINNIREKINFIDKFQSQQSNFFYYNQLRYCWLPEELIL